MGNHGQASDIREGFLKGMMLEQKPEGVEVNWGQMEAAACAKALHWAGERVVSK